MGCESCDLMDDARDNGASAVMKHTHAPSPQPTPAAWRGVNLDRAEMELTRANWWRTEPQTIQYVGILVVCALGGAW